MNPGPRPTGAVPAPCAVLPVGDRALLVECAGSAEAVALWQRLRRDAPAGVEEPVVAARTVLVRVAEGRLDRVRAALERLLREAGPADDRGPGGSDGPGEDLGRGPEVVLETVYDGADLDVVASTLGTSPDGVVARHGATTWTSAFLGFAPGFAYLHAQGPWPDVPRRSTPRTRVPAGSVALAGPWSAVYPASSPGGWQLLGRTPARVWDVERPLPALLPPGTRVRFRAVRAVVRLAPDTPALRAHDEPHPVEEPVPRPTSGGAATSPPALEVVHPGPLCLVQDLGRRGHLGLGVPTSGALDRGAAVRANRLVGNDRGAALLEVLLGGLALRALTDLVVAVAGAPVPVRVLRSDGSGSGALPGRPFLVPQGAELTLGTPSVGLRTYVAVRGGLDVPAVLGSRATDVLSGLGPPPVRAGDLLGLLPPSGSAVPVEADPAAGDVPHGPDHVVRVLPGPRGAWLTPVARQRLHDTAWEVTDHSNRVGLRLAGPALDRAVTAELPSEGTVPGAVQVPPDGRPVVFLADHPVTGGYPVVAVVRDADLDRLGQVRPGERLRLLRAGAGGGPG